jgi:raffinose/stachyose/melibiose transport system substrate-binding protein
MGDLGCFGDGALGRTRDQAGEVVAKGNALAMVDVGATLAPMLKLSPDTSFVTAAIPATNTGNTYIVALPGFVTTINAKAKNVAAAQAFLDFMGEPEQAATYAYGFQGVPVLPNDVYKAPAELTEFSKLIAEGKYAPLGSVQAEVQTTLNQGIQSLILGKETPEGVAQKMEDVYKR